MHAQPCNVAWSRTVIPEITPELPHIEGFIANGFSTVLPHEIWSIALDKIKAPAGEANVLFEPVHPVHEALAQVPIGVVKICMPQSGPSHAALFEGAGCSHCSLVL